MSLPILAIHLDDLGNIGAAVTGVATVLLFVAAAVGGWVAKTQLIEQRKIAMRTRAYAHLGIFNSRDFTELSSEAAHVVSLFSEEKAPSKKIWRELSDAERTSVQTCLNFYEEIANEYNAGFLDQQAAEPLVFVAVVMWRRANVLIEWLRHGDRRYFDQWEKLYLDHASVMLTPEYSE